jgi:hypothetical protein
MLRALFRRSRSTPRAAADWRTFRAISGLTRPFPLATRDTVAILTPAARLTSSNVLLGCFSFAKLQLEHIPFSYARKFSQIAGKLS